MDGGSHWYSILSAVAGAAGGSNDLGWSEFWSVAPALGGGIALLLFVAAVVGRVLARKEGTKLAAVDKGTSEGLKIVEEFANTHAFISLMAETTEDERRAKNDAAAHAAQESLKHRELRLSQTFSMFVFGAVIFAIVAVVAILTAPATGGAASSSAVTTVDAQSSSDGPSCREFVLMDPVAGRASEFVGNPDGGRARSLTCPTSEALVGIFGSNLGDGGGRDWFFELGAICAPLTITKTGELQAVTKRAHRLPTVLGQYPSQQAAFISECPEGTFVAAVDLSTDARTEGSDHPLFVSSIRLHCSIAKLPPCSSDPELSFHAVDSLKMIGHAYGPYWGPGKPYQTQVACAESGGGSFSPGYIAGFEARAGALVDALKPVCRSPQLVASAQ